MATRRKKTDEEAPTTAQEAPNEEEQSPTQLEAVADDLSAVPLALKLARIAQEVGDRKPEGKNNHFTYAYFTDKQLSGIFQQRFAKYGIVMVPNVIRHEIIEGKTNKGGTTYMTNLHVQFTFHDGHTGETIVGSGFGQGDDPGDKGANKAMTGAVKYFLIKTFQIGGEADAEADDATDQRTTSPRAQVTERKPAEVKQSAPTGEVKKGGRQQNATQAQTTRIIQLAKELNIGGRGIASVIGKVTESEVSLTEGKERDELAALMGSLSSDQLGEVVKRLEEAKSRHQGDLTAEAEGIFEDMSAE